MEFIREPQMIEINGGWCIGINNEDCQHDCSCEGVNLGCDIDICGFDNC